MADATPTKPFGQQANIAILGMSLLLAGFFIVFLIAIVRATNPGPEFRISTSDYRSAGTVGSLKVPGGTLAAITTSNDFEYDFTTKDILTSSKDGPKLKVVQPSLTEEETKTMIKFNKGLEITGSGIIGQITNFGEIIYVNPTDSLSGSIRLDTSMPQEVSIMFSRSFYLHPELFSIVFKRGFGSESIVYLNVFGEEPNKVFERLIDVPDSLELQFSVMKEIMTLKVIKAGTTAILKIITAPYTVGATIINSIFITSSSSDPTVEPKARLQHLTLKSTTTTTLDARVTIDITAMSAMSRTITYSPDGFPTVTNKFVSITNNIIPNESSVICPFSKVAIVPNVSRVYKDEKGLTWKYGDVVIIKIEGPANSSTSNPMKMLLFKYFKSLDFKTANETYFTTPYDAVTVTAETTVNKFSSTPVTYVDNKSSATESFTLTFDLCNNVAKVAHNRLQLSIDNAAAVLGPFNCILLGSMGSSMLKHVQVTKYLQRVLVK